MGGSNNTGSILYTTQLLRNMISVPDFPKIATSLSSFDSGKINGTAQERKEEKRKTERKFICPNAFYKLGKKQHKINDIKTVKNFGNMYFFLKKNQTLIILKN